MITSIAVNGTDLDLDLVEWQLAIDHGRNDITSAPQASTAELTIRGTGALPAAIGDTITIEAFGVPRFTGTISDIDYSHEAATNGQHTGRLHLTAMGSLATLGLIEVGEAGYAEENLNYRVTGILDESGIPYTANVVPYMVLLARPAGQAQTALQMLSDLCGQTGATMCDLPDGNFLFESYATRGYGYNPATFAQVTDTFADVPYIWADVYDKTSAAPTPVALPLGGVVWEPVWKTSVLSVLNRVTVQYGDANPQDAITVDDAGSIATYGQRSAILSTNLADITDAYDRATHVITAQGAPHYNLQSVQILVDTLDTYTRGKVLELVQGDRVLITGLPEPAPNSTYLGVIEGWSESHTPAGHLLTLALSDPRYSYAMCAWSEISTTITWTSMNQAVSWYDVITPTDLLAA